MMQSGIPVAQSGNVTPTTQYQQMDTSHFNGMGLNQQTQPHQQINYAQM